LNTVKQNAGHRHFSIVRPFTARDMDSSLSPEALRNTFDAEEGGDPHALHILDLTEVPYIDSTGLGHMSGVRAEEFGWLWPE